MTTDKQKTAQDVRIVPYSCVFIDASLSDFVSACCSSLFTKTPALSTSDAIAGLFDPSMKQAIVCLCARTAFDLFLRAMCFPPQSEIIMTAVNIPGMVEIVRHHQLVPIPLDIQLNTLGPSIDDFKKLISTRTVACLVAHLYGRWLMTEELARIAHANGLYFIEDCAECFTGFDYVGNSAADLRLFSFGPIKYFTCFGGGVALVKDATAFKKMQSLNSLYPVQSYGQYVSKVLKYAATSLVLNQPNVMRPGMWLTRKLNIDHKAIVVNLLRGFPTDMINQIRKQPCRALLEFMHQRLTNLDSNAFNRITAKGKFIQRLLPLSLMIPGIQCMNENPNYWLFPVIVDNPSNAVKELNVRGIDAYQGATQLSVIDISASNASFLIDHLL